MSQNFLTIQNTLLKGYVMSAVITTTSQAVELVLLSGKGDVLSTRYLPSFDVAVEQAIQSGACTIDHETLDL